MTPILKEINGKIENGKKLLGVLIDPDNLKSIEELEHLIVKISTNTPNYIFVGGSLINNDLFKSVIKVLKSNLSIPVIIFPGNNNQICKDADGILLLSLISGRNPDLLIGQHVSSAFELQKSGLEILPTGYTLVDCGKSTSVQYMSNTSPIPYSKNGIAAATVLAGEQLGLSLFYLDGGSGAEKPISKKMITSVKKTISSPLIVGGGLRTKEDIENAWEAGADLVIIGTAFEKDPNFLSSLKQY